MPRAMLRAVLMPGEIEDHMADADLNGPWWEERADYLLAKRSQSEAALHGAATRLGDHMVEWDPKPPELWGWDQVEKVLDALVAAGGK